jgi:asparagine synthase (glutamine-hydrolysing)
VLCERAPQWSRVAISRLLRGLPAWGPHRSVVRRLQKFAASASLPFTERFSRWIAVFYEDLPRLLRSGVWDQGGLSHGTAPPPLEAIQPHVNRARSASPLAQLLYLNLKTYLLDDLLVKMDRCSMAHALEARSPFLDTTLLEYVFGLPDAMKLRGGRTKVILREAFADVVPRPILQRGKMGFGVPLRLWFAEDLRDYLHDVLLAPTAALRRYVDPAYVRELVEQHLAGHVDYSDRLWTLLTFEVWLHNLPLAVKKSVAGEGRLSYNMDSVFRN